MTNCGTCAVASSVHVTHNSNDRDMNGCGDGFSTDHKHYVITGISDLGNSLKTDANGMYHVLREPLSKI